MVGAIGFEPTTLWSQTRCATRLRYAPTKDAFYREEFSMSTPGIRIVRLGSERAAGEGLRIGTVRRPPRGVPKAEFASQNWYDVWYPNLAPTPETMKLGQEAQTDKDWTAFTKRYRSEMAEA